MKDRCHWSPFCLSLLLSFLGGSRCLCKARMGDLSHTLGSLKKKPAETVGKVSPGLQLPSSVLVGLVTCPLWEGWVCSRLFHHIFCSVPGPGGLECLCFLFGPGRAIPQSTQPKLTVLLCVGILPDLYKALQPALRLCLLPPLPCWLMCTSVLLSWGSTGLEFCFNYLLFFLLLCCPLCSKAPTDFIAGRVFPSV